MRFVIGVMMAAIGLMGCADGVGTAAESDQVGTQSSPLTFKTRSELPACDATTASLFAYIEAEDVTVGCLEGTWQKPAASN